MQRSKHKWLICIHRTPPSTFAVVSTCSSVCDLRGHVSSATSGRTPQAGWREASPELPSRLLLSALHQWKHLCCLWGWARGYTAARQHFNTPKSSRPLRGYLGHAPPCLMPQTKQLSSSLPEEELGASSLSSSPPLALPQTHISASFIPADIFTVNFLNRCHSLVSFRKKCLENSCI